MELLLDLAALRWYDQFWVALLFTKKFTQRMTKMSVLA
jgi:hypothetical protein